MNSRKQVADVPQHLSPISIAQALLQHRLYVFDSRTVAALFELNPYQTARWLRRLERDGLITRPERGKYLLLGFPRTGAFQPSAHRLPSALSCLHLLLVGVALSRLHRAGAAHRLRRYHAPQSAVERPRDGLSVRHTPSAALFRLADLPLLVADEAKAILDSLFLPRYAAGLAEVAKALRNALAAGTVESALLAEYAARFGNSSLSARLEYLLEKLGQPVDGLSAASGPVRLDPQRAERGCSTSAGRCMSTSQPRSCSPKEWRDVDPRPNPTAGAALRGRHSSPYISYFNNYRESNYRSKI